MDQIITTAAERAQGAVDEPRLTVSQLERLLRANAELERGKRPIIITSSAEQVVIPPGMGGRVPSPAEFEGVVAWAPLRRPVPVRMWGVRVACVGIAALLAGAADAAATDGNGVSIALCIVGLGAIVGGTARGVAEQDKASA